MTEPLFDIPPDANEASRPFPCGGLGAGSICFNPLQGFDQWRLDPGVFPVRKWASHCHFHLWTSDHRAKAVTLAYPGFAAQPWGAHLGFLPEVRRLFPVSWITYSGLPLDLGCRAFSPFLPGDTEEISLPVGVFVWRLRNSTDKRMEAAMMLTWACDLPEPVPDAGFDLQHDNLCITGSLGSAASENRFGIAVPDLHSEGIYLQGVEPWCIPDGAAEVWRQFSESGELDPSIASQKPLGAAAWVKMDLDPGEVRDIPFVVAWHSPTYTTGPLAGSERRYVRHLGRFRPDNAIVWLAEQVVQNYGLETANWVYWLQAIADWHQKPELFGVHPDDVEAIASADISWNAEGQLEVLPPNDDVAAMLAPGGAATRLWPGVFGG